MKEQLATGEKLKGEISSLKAESIQEDCQQLEEELEKMEQLMAVIEEALKVKLSKLLSTYAPNLKVKTMNILEETFHP